MLEVCTFYLPRIVLRKSYQKFPKFREILESKIEFNREEFLHQLFTLWEADTVEMIQLY